MQEWVHLLILGTVNKTIGEAVCNGSNISVPGQPDDQCSYKGGLGGGWRVEVYIHQWFF